MNNKLLVTGQRRSGTTFLANFLNAQQGITVYRDSFKFFFRNPETVNLKAAGHIRDYHKVISESEKAELITHFETEIDILEDLRFLRDSKKIFDVSKSQNMNEWYNSILEEVCQKDDVLVGNKVTGVEANLKNIVNIEGLKVLYIIRDVRDVYLSAKKKFKGYPPLEVVADWNTAAEVAQSIDQPNFFFMRYEDFIFKNEQVLANLEAFLGMKLDYNISGAKDIKSGFISNSSNTDVSNMFDPTAVFRWKSKAGNQDVQYAYLKSKHNIEKLGYSTMEDPQGFGVSGYERAVKKAFYKNKFYQKVYRFLDKVKGR